MNWKMLSVLGAAAFLAAGSSNLAAQDGAAGKYADRYTKDTFAEADTNQDGFVSWDEARSIGTDAEKTRFGRERFDAADADGDGRLSAGEAATLIGKETSQKGEGAGALKERVAESESGSKARSARETTSGKYMEHYTKDQFDAVDSDGDGFVSRAEAKGASSDAERELFGGERFDAADADGDGRLSPGEARTLRQKEMSHKELGSSKAKQRKAYKDGDSSGSGEGTANADGRKKTAKRKRYEEASAKRHHENPRVVRKEHNTKRRHRAHRPADVGD